MGRSGRPGLLGTAARTAVVAGTATAVSGRVAAQQGAPVAAQPPPAPAPVAESPVAALERLAALHGQGLLTDEEFASAKATVLKA